MITIYEKMTEELTTNKEWGTITEMLGKDTEFEAIYLVSCDEDSMWSGQLVFKDHRYSPPEQIDGLPHGALQFFYYPPGAANGVLAAQRAEDYWKTLCGIFSALKQPIKIDNLNLISSASGANTNQYIK